MTKEEVLQEFIEGRDCCQVVFAHMAKNYNIEEEMVYKISTGFGAGMLQGETCGAIIGAYMALGLKYGSSETGEKGQNQKVSSIIKNEEFRTRFIEKYSSTMCCELLQADFSTPEGKRVIQENQLMTTFCPKLVSDIIAILSSMGV